MREASTLSVEEIVHKRRAFQVPITEKEKAFLLEARDEIESLAGFMRDAAIARAEKKLKKKFKEDR